MLDGRAVAMGRKVAWHRLNVVTGDVFGLDDIERDCPEILLPVASTPISEVDPFHHYGAFTGTSLAIREDGKVVGINGARYEIVQNRDAFELGTTTGRDCISAINLREGRQSAFTFDLGAYTVGDEPCHDYISILNSHDGSWPLIALKSSVIVVCANTASWALQGAAIRQNIRHTASWEDRVADVRQALGLAEQARQTFTETVETLMLQPVTMRAFDLLLDAVFPVPEDDGRGRTMRENARLEVRTLFSEGAVVENYRRTGWGAVQAVNTWEQWSAPIRAGAKSSSATTRARRQIEALAAGKAGQFTAGAVRHLASVV
jgi:hypothetical protein